MKNAIMKFNSQGTIAYMVPKFQKDFIVRSKVVAKQTN